LTQVSTTFFKIGTEQPLHIELTIFIFPFQTQQVHAMLQRPGQDQVPHPETTNHSRKAGTRLQGTGHPDAISRLMKNI